MVRPTSPITKPDNVVLYLFITVIRFNQLKYVLSLNKKLIYIVPNLTVLVFVHAVRDLKFNIMFFDEVIDPN